jgi:hypothetical protein
MADPNDLLVRAEAEEAAAVAALEERASPFGGLYAHWERNQWSALALDLETDKRSFDALDPAARSGMVWIFAQRFHAEFSVARLLAPFLLSAPTYDVQLLLATQVADEHRHLQAVLRICEEVFGVRGGIDAVREVDDRNLDLVTEALYERLEHYMGRLTMTSGEAERDDSLRRQATRRPSQRRSRVRSQRRMRRGAWDSRAAGPPSPAFRGAPSPASSRPTTASCAVNPARASRRGRVLRGGLRRSRR